MSDQSTDPAPNQPDPPRTPPVTTGVAQSVDVPVAADSQPSEEVRDADGSTVVIGLDAAGNTTEVLEVVDTAAVNLTGGEVLPNGEYGYRPEPIPGPSVEQIKLVSVEGYDPGPSAQEQIMTRAQAQADAIVKAAEDAVAAMDEAEAASKQDG